MLCDKHTLADDSQCWRCRVAELEATLESFAAVDRARQAENDAWAEKWLTERTENAKLREAIQHCDPLCPAWAALEGKQDG